MKFVPLFKCTDFKRTLAFYCDILDFKLRPGDTEDDWVVTLEYAGAELMLTRVEGDQRPAINACVVVDDVDLLYSIFKKRGLTSNQINSLVHLGPVDQTWGAREFYVTDPDGNTLRFIERS